MELRFNATRLVASVYGALVGLAGIEHGFFETLQGNVAPSGLMIEAIGPANRFWAGGTEPALTIIPNFFITGILAMIIGLLVVIWSAAFLDRKHGPLVLLILCTTLFLVGGGIAPIFLSIVAVFTATRINKPLTLWRKLLRGKSQVLLAKMFPWSFIIFLILYFVSVEIAIFGWFFVLNNLVSIVWTFAYVMLAFMVFTVITAFAYDIKKVNNIR
ncbi:MAG: hypothetical protein ACXVHW_11495 [Methanobacterium sp.]